MTALLAQMDPRRSRGQRRERVRLLTALPLALVAHGMLVGLIALSASLRTPKPPRPQSRPVVLRPIAAARWASNRGPATRSVPDRPAPLHPRGQVVDVAPGNDRVPVESKYLAESNNRVKEQTRAREQTQTWSRATPTNTPHPTELPSARGRPPPQGQVQAAPGLLSSILGRRPFRPFTEPTTPGAAEAAPTTDEPAPVGTAAGSQATGGELTEGGGAPNDALSDVPVGDGTFLNTREWKYAGFYNRVKQAVSARWDPNGRLRARNRQVGFQDRLTVVHVTLRPDGTLAEAYVAQSSGLEDLDAEAVRAFEKAQPFANPPAALVKQGAIQFNFSFTLTNNDLAGGAPRFMRFTH